MSPVVFFEGKLLAAFAFFFFMVLYVFQFFYNQHENVLIQNIKEHISQEKVRLLPCPALRVCSRSPPKAQLVPQGSKIPGSALLRLALPSPPPRPRSLSTSRGLPVLCPVPVRKPWVSNAGGRVGRACT